MTDATLTNLTGNPASDRAAEWSPDGTQIAFVSDRDGDLDVYAMNADGTGVRQLTNDPARDNVPAWSPDGSLIAFSSDRANPGVAFDLYVMSAVDGSGVNRVTALRGDDPSWQAPALHHSLWERRKHRCPGGSALARGHSSRSQTNASF